MGAKEAGLGKRPAGSLNAWLVGFLAWLVPGSGHLFLGRWLRGVLAGVVVWTLFLVGLFLGGHLFGPLSGEEGSNIWLQVPPAIANLGSGILYLFCWLTNTGFANGGEQARLATFEYGNTFLLVAGLLNYLVALDAFDIGVRRKL